MATITERICRNKKVCYTTYIRMNDIEEKKTFLNREDAEVYADWKENLIRNFKNFNVPIRETIRLIDVFELKRELVKDQRTYDELDLSYQRVYSRLKQHIFLCELDYRDWKDCFDRISTIEIPIKHNAKTKVIISPNSVRRIFATLSSAFSSAIEKGIDIENYPAMIIQKVINPSLKKSDILNK